MSEPEYVPILDKVTVEDACKLLDDQFGSGCDPIWVDGVETTPQDLQYGNYADWDARKLHVEFYAVHGPGPRVRKVRAPLYSMLLDRGMPRPKVSDRDLRAMAREAMRRFDALPPEEQEELRFEQRVSWAYWQLRLSGREVSKEFVRDVAARYYGRSRR